MSKLKTADFYYGAVLSTLFNNHINPALIEGGDDRQVYDFTTNKGDFRMFVKYRAENKRTKRVDYFSWDFNLINDIDEIKGYIAEGKNLVLFLVCGMKDLKDSELAILDKGDLIELFELGKNTITISRKKGEKFYRIAVGGGRTNSKQIKASRIEELL